MQIVLADLDTNQTMTIAQTPSISILRNINQQGPPGALTPDGPFTFKKNKGMKLSELISALIADRDIQVTELSKRADVNRSYIYRKLQGDDKNLDRIFEVLTGDIQPDELILAMNLIKSIKLNQQIL